MCFASTLNVKRAERESGAAPLPLLRADRRRHVRCDRSRAFLLERENGMRHSTGTGILQPSSHQRAARWTPAALTPPLAPPAKLAPCHLSGMTPVHADIARCANGAWPHRCQYDHDLHPYAQSKVMWRTHLGASHRPARGCREQWSTRACSRVRLSLIRNDVGREIGLCGNTQ